MRGMDILVFRKLKKENNMWLDGICKKCGSIVIETPCTMEVEEEFANDYKNLCTNSSCTEYKWHYVRDQEELEYYIHIVKLDENILLKECLQQILKDELC